MATTVRCCVGSCSLIKSISNLSLYPTSKIVRLIAS
uniref:Uncharacterized protein n=1 Tax=Arundo donax TaxID=35708 RepID=A0A0A8Z0I2_ARUDO